MIKELDSLHAKILKHKDFSEVVTEAEIEALIEAKYHNSRWIPCSERLPEYEVEAEYYRSVIVTLDNGRVAEGCYRNLEGQWWVDAEDGEHYSINATGHVVAWQPLPEPYRGEN